MENSKLSEVTRQIKIGVYRLEIAAIRKTINAKSTIHLPFFKDATKE
jgi:hypothetical protein